MSKNAQEIAKSIEKNIFYILQIQKKSKKLRKKTWEMMRVSYENELNE